MTTASPLLLGQQRRTGLPTRLCAGGAPGTAGASFVHSPSPGACNRSSWKLIQSGQAYSFAEKSPPRRENPCRVPAPICPWLGEERDESCVLRVPGRCRVNGTDSVKARISYLSGPQFPLVVGSFWGVPNQSPRCTSVLCGEFELKAAEACPDPHPWKNLN